MFAQRRTKRSERRRRGRRLRETIPLEAHAEIPQDDDRAAPISILQRQEADRLSEFSQLRYERMAASPFAFLRGAAAIMASDLAMVARTPIRTQLCGDAHLSNFGMFSSQERRLMFDINDFDETLPGPFEWDVKRLAASVVVAAEELELADGAAFKAARAAVKSYRKTMARLAAMPTLDVWFASLDVDSILDNSGKSELSAATRKARKKARIRTSDTAADKLTEKGAHVRRFRSEPPILIRPEGVAHDEAMEGLAGLYAQYLSTLPPDRLALLARFSVTDVAHKVVGVGSVGTRALVLLLESGDGEPLLLQVKQAGESVLSAHLGPSELTNGGQRVVLGQQAMQAGGDPFLGWTRGTQTDYYVRQLKDMKGAIDLSTLGASSLKQYARLCGAVLARAHARTGDASLITGYLGEGESFDAAVAEFATGYARLTAHDHKLLREFVSQGSESSNL
ncbi:MAG: DUF2252 domain-containing protein [Actinobacteria bacterium]|nr:DUF2252 domain-containing protein [Actinomycetota bacterium]